MSLRSRIALVATALVLAAVLVNTLLQTIAARRAVLDQARAGGASLAGVLARAVSFASEVPLQVEAEVGQHMVAESRLLALYAAAADKAGLGVAEITEQLRGVTTDTILDEMLVTDAGVAATINTERLPETFVFSSDPARQPQARTSPPSSTR